MTDSPELITLTITDQAPPFSPDDTPPVDTESSWEERQIGGYGWHLVRTMMDTVHHEITPAGGNRVRLTRRKD
jgi:serine/threonine-protein kinase RsbW